MNNSSHAEPEWSDLSPDLRGLHVKYWHLSRLGNADFPPRNFDEFAVFFANLDQIAQGKFIAELRCHFKQLMNAEIEEAEKVIKKYMSE